MLAGVEPKPDQADRFFETLGEIARELREGELSADLLERARKPVLYQHYASESTNPYWVEGLRDVQSDPRNLDRLRTALRDLGTINEADIVAAAREVLDDKRRVDVRVLPQ
jgi:zinc protease